MDPLDHLAQVAQLAGTKRKHASEAELELPGQAFAPNNSANCFGGESWTESWTYTNPTLHRSMINVPYQANQATESSLGFHIGQQADTQSRNSRYTFNPTSRSANDHQRQRSDAFTNPSASSSTVHSPSNWQDGNSTTSTSYASTPNLDGHFGQAIAFPSNHYSNPYANLHTGSLYPQLDGSVNFQRTSIDKTLPGSTALDLDYMFRPLPMDLDCRDESVICNDPTCQDGIPCPGPELPACDKANCDDAIPCPSVPFTTFGAPSTTSYPEPTGASQECSLSPSGEVGVCFSDKCPQDTRCPSPCFEESCGVPPCDQDHQTELPWEWSQNACVDPRHTFNSQPPHNHNDNISWCDGFHYHVPMATNNADRHATNLLLSSEEVRTGDVDRHDHAEHHEHHEHRDHHEHHEQNVVSQGRAVKSGHSHTNAGCCSGAKARHQHHSKRPPREHKHACQWVTHGDSRHPDAEICGHEFTNARDLQLHVVTHIDGLEREDQLFPCRWKGCKHRFCDGFTARPKLKRHLMVHTGATPYKCDEPGCNVEMKTKDALDKHKRTHTGAKPYKCTHQDCESRFATSTELKTHLIVHSGQKPHKCPRCGDCFADSSNLSKHKKVHEVPKFKCPDCDYKMKRWDQMRRHFKSQGHAVYIIENKTAEAEYKKKMNDAFEKLTPEERILPLSREGSMESVVSSDAGVRASTETAESMKMEGDI